MFSWLTGSIGAHAQDAGKSAFSWLTPTPATGWRPPDTFVFNSFTDRSAWKVGAFAGQFNRDPEYVLWVTPWIAYNKFWNAYIAGADAVYTMFRFPKVPLNFEIDFSASAHFGGQDYAELAASPAVRWTWFPWNNWIYTNFRIGALGPSVTTALSRFEAKNTNNKYTTYFLCAGVEEWTFAPSPDSPWEVFFRVQHRSGIFGLIDGVDGGSNYLTLGWRTQL
jgi:hypothetical protein